MSEDTSPQDKFRLDIVQRITKIESRVCQIATDIHRNTKLTEELYGVLRGIQSIGRGIVWVGGVCGGCAIIWAAFTFAVKQAV